MKEKENYRQGIIYGFTSYVLWGILPLYWKSIQGADAFEILANRIIWSAVFVGLLLVSLGKMQAFWAETRSILQDKKKTLTLIAAAFMVSLNWGIYIWAVAADRIIETSMGYYINPLVNVLFGVVLLGEKLDFLAKMAVIFAAIGVGNMVYSLGVFPWLSLSLAVTFGLYGLIKKTLVVETKTSILLETVIVMPLALLYIGTLAAQGQAAYQHCDALALTLLVGAGIVTALPLLLFTAAAKLLPLSLVGFLQYVSPTITLIIGIFVYGENFTATHLFSFAWIWLGLVIFSVSQIRKR